MRDSVSPSSALRIWREVLDVGAGDEVVGLAAAEDDPLHARRRSRSRRGCRSPARPSAPPERVDLLAGHVEGEHEDAVVAELAAEGAGAHWSATPSPRRRSISVRGAAGPPSTSSVCSPEAGAARADRPASRTGGRRGDVRRSASPPAARVGGARPALPRASEVEHRLHAHVGGAKLAQPSSRSRAANGAAQRLDRLARRAPRAHCRPTQVGPARAHGTAPSQNFGSSAPTARSTAVAAAVDAVAGVGAGQLVEPRSPRQQARDAASSSGASTPSSSDTSTTCPRPVRSRAWSAARMPMAASRPPVMSATCVAGSTGRPSASRLVPRKPPSAR